FIRSSVFNRSRGHCLERQNYIEDLRNGPIRKNWDSSVSRTSGFEDSVHMMETVHTANKSVNQGPKYNLHPTPGYPTSRRFHTQTQDFQQSERSPTAFGSRRSFPSERTQNKKQTESRLPRKRTVESRAAETYVELIGANTFLCTGRN
ncbi:hypothetical protein E2I00_018866, partial [Balaenoptera physalus]